jgi:hypothetical protein
MTPDPYGGSRSPKNPTSWNRYSYVLGDPINLNDVTGLCGVNLGGTFGTTVDCNPPADPGTGPSTGTSSDPSSGTSSDPSAGPSPSNPEQPSGTDENGNPIFVATGTGKSSSDSSDDSGSADPPPTTSPTDPTIGGGILPPGADPASQAAKQATRGYPRTTPPRPLQPGPDPRQTPPVPKGTNPTPWYSKPWYIRLFEFLGGPFAPDIFIIVNPCTINPHQQSCNTSGA